MRISHRGAVICCRGRENVGYRENVIFSRRDRHRACNLHQTHILYQAAEREARNACQAPLLLKNEAGKSSHGEGRRVSNVLRR